VLDQLIYEQHLRDERDELLRAHEKVDSPSALLEFQLQLAEAIASHEPQAHQAKNRLAKEHLRLLRLLGDGLAWKYLHSYVVRQLAKNPAPPPALTNQRDGWHETLAAAVEIAARGHLVLVADLTHVVTVGDLIICDDPERPAIIECGGHKDYLHVGRKARQLRRARAISKLLNEGVALLPGNSMPTATLAISTEPRYKWDVLERAILGAEQERVAACSASDAELVFAVTGGEELAEHDALDGSTAAMEEPVVAVYTRLLERPDPRVPRCVAWAISEQAKRLEPG
jgi:hypothetical protein